MSAARKRVAVLISGRGSNMMSLVEAARSADFPAEIALVASNRPDAAGLAWAASKGLATLAVDHKRFSTRDAFEAELNAGLDAHRIELVCLAGFMRLVTPGFVARWLDRMINIHPSLLPAYKGLHTHERVLADGARITGCTVHFVRAEMDTGPIIAQAAVPVRSDDTPDILSARVLAAEHVLYPHALRLVASGSTAVNDDHVRLAGEPPVAPPLYSPMIPALR